MSKKRSSTLNNPSISTHTSSRLYSVRQVANLTSFSKSHLYRMVESGAIGHYRLGNAIRIDLDEVLRCTRQDPKEATSSRETDNATKTTERSLVVQLHLPVSDDREEEAIPEVDW